MSFSMILQSPRLLLALLGLFTVGLLASGVVLEHGFGVLPCQMCWWQRYAHVAIVICAAVGVYLQQERYAVSGVAAAALVGLGIAGWQVAAQQGLLPFPASCTAHGAAALVAGADLLAAMATTKVIPCDLETFKLFGLSLAAWNVPCMLIVLGGSLRVWVYSRA